jgi:hypothetical protein
MNGWKYTNPGAARAKKLPSHGLGEASSEIPDKWSAVRTLEVPGRQIPRRLDSGVTPRATRHILFVAATMNLYCGEELFPARKVEVGLAAGTRLIDNCLPLRVELFRQLAFFILSCKPILYCRFKRIDVYIL